MPLHRTPSYTRQLMLEVNAGADVIELDEVPGDLRAAEIWVAWLPQIEFGTGLYLDPDSGRPYRVRKVPIGVNGEPARPVGLPLETARQLALQHGGGLGILLRPGDGWFCLDLDLHSSALTPDCELVQQLIRQLGGWAHLSPSGHGVHIMGRAQLPAGHPTRLTLPDLGAAELYSRNQFITVTTLNYDETYDETLPDRTSELLSLLHTAATPVLAHRSAQECDTSREASGQHGTPQRRGHAAAQTTKGASKAHPVPRGLHRAPVAERVKLMRQRRPDVADMLDGRLDGAGEPLDISKVEFSLLGHLYYWLDGDAADMKAVMEASAFGQGRGRPEKWGTTRNTQPYLEYAIDRLRQKRAGELTYRDEARGQLYRDRTVTAQLYARLAAAPGHGHTRAACERLLDELLAQACGPRVRKLSEDQLVLPISMGGLLARLGGRHADILKRLQHFQTLGIIAGLHRQSPNSRAPWRVVLHGQAGALAAALQAQPVTELPRSQRARIQASPAGVGRAARALPLRTLAPVARAVLQHELVTVDAVIQATGHQAPTVRRWLRQLQDQNVLTVTRGVITPLRSWQEYAQAMNLQTKEQRHPAVTRWNTRVRDWKERQAVWRLQETHKQDAS
ncbi:hypothetical protein [Deinococcus marmoris]|uniref:hypothetical protein n=1 Tax=Deinococcus marmoris TaxID=249408 RepID=UPI0012DDF994|nr:hypothetical protein [Deinococcus marmoris]